MALAQILVDMPQGDGSTTPVSLLSLVYKLQNNWRDRLDPKVNPLNLSSAPSKSEALVAERWDMVVPGEFVSPSVKLWRKSFFWIPNMNAGRCTPCNPDVR